MTFLMQDGAPTQFHEQVDNSNTVLTRLMKRGGEIYSLAVIVIQSLLFQFETPST